MNRILLLAAICSAPISCIDAPIHDDPGSVLAGHDDIQDANAFFADAKDDHWYQMYNPTIDAEVQAIINSGRAPGCAVGVVEDGEIQYMKTYGRIRPNGPKWTMETVSPVASVGKTFTAMAIMRLQERGLLDIDDPIRMYYPEASYRFRNNTIRELLSHRTGIPHIMPRLPAYASCNNYPGATEEWCMTQPESAFAYYNYALRPSAPGNNSNGEPRGIYSNVNYAILGAIIDKVTRTSWLIAPEQKGYEAFVWHSIAHYAQNVADQRELHSLALSYEWRDGDFADYAEGFCTGPKCNPTCVGTKCNLWESGGVNFVAPAGYWVLTIGDFTRFVRAQIAGEILTQNSWDQMRVPHTDVVNGTVWDNRMDYGLGMQLHTPGNVGYANREYYHAGEAPGHTAVWLVSSPIPNTTADDVGVALVCNGAFRATNDNSVNDELIEIARNIAANGAAGTRIRKLPATLGSSQRVALHGKKYKVDPARSRLKTHDALFLPMLTTSTWNFEMSFSRGRLRARINNIRPSPNSSTNYVDLGALSIVQGTHAKSTPRTIAINSMVGPIKLKNAVFRFAFNSSQGQLTDGSLSGTLDMRQAASVPGAPSWQQLCGTSASEDNRACNSCSDGVKACLSVSWDRLGGPKVNSF